jgi:hypothetical protein
MKDAEGKFQNLCHMTTDKAMLPAME